MSIIEPNHLYPKLEHIFPTPLFNFSLLEKKIQKSLILEFIFKYNRTRFLDEFMKDLQNQG